MDPEAGIQSLRTALSAGASELRFERYRPHITLGTFLRTEPTGPAASVIESMRLGAPRPLTLRRVERVGLDPSLEGAPLITRAWVDLG